MEARWPLCNLWHAGGPHGALSSIPCPSRQALSKRIHYGMFVAEAKFRKQVRAL